MPGTMYFLEGHIFKRRYVTTAFKGNEGGTKGRIQGFSPTAVGRMRRYLRACSADYRVMVTLTYPSAYPEEGRHVKRDLDVFIKRLRRNFPFSGEAKFSIFWFLEFQERGAPHFHLFCTHSLPKDWCARAWYETVGSGDSRHLAAGTRVEALRSGRYGSCAYAAKYAAKCSQKLVPAQFLNVGRFWGVSGLRKCSSAVVYFPVGEESEKLHKEFRIQAKKILLGEKTLKKAGYFITDEGKLSGLREIMLRFGLLCSAKYGFRPVLVEHPLMGSGEDSA